MTMYPADSLVARSACCTTLWTPTMLGCSTSARNRPSSTAGSGAVSGGSPAIRAPRFHRGGRLLPGRERRGPGRRLAGRPLEDAEPVADAGPAERAGPVWAGTGWAGTGWAGTGWAGTGWAGTRARPQLSQYPPSIVPPPPGRAHLVRMGVPGVAPVPPTP